MVVYFSNAITTWPFSYNKINIYCNIKHVHTLLNAISHSQYNILEYYYYCFTTCYDTVNKLYYILYTVQMYYIALMQ